MKTRDISFSVSCRNKPQHWDMKSWLATYNSRVKDVGSISSVFGFVEFTSLYGGRGFNTKEITDNDLEFLGKHNINLRLPLTNMFVDEKMYETSREFLDKHYNDRTSIICASTFLAKKIRKDYPDYKLEASAVIDINPDKVEEYLELYDTVVLPPSMSDKYEELEKIHNKEKVTVFGRGGCAYTCPSKICYASISKVHKGESDRHKCSLEILPRKEVKSVIEFDLEPLIKMGFSNFKLTSSSLGWSY